MLAAGQVDAIAGFSFSMFFNLRARGVPADNIGILLMSDFGLAVYGNAIMVNPDFAKANPHAVKGFVKATLKGWQDAVREPEAAVKRLMERNTIADEQVELERLKMALRDNVVTAWVLANGFGNIDKARMARSIDQIAVSYDFFARPAPDDVFTAEFLPPKTDRTIRQIEPPRRQDR